MNKLLLSILGAFTFGVINLIGEEGGIISNKMPSFLQRVISKQLNNNKSWYRYICEEREIIDELTNSGKVMNSESETYTWIHTKLQSFSKLIAINGARYDNSFLEAQDKKINQLIANVEAMSEQEQNKLFHETQLKRERGALPTLFKNFLMAFIFSHQGEQEINGIKTLVIGFSPQDSFKTSSRESLFLTKMEGKLWVTKQTNQIIRFTAILNDDVQYLAGILGSIKKGATITFEQANIGNGLWFPTFKTLTYRKDIIFKSSHLRRTNLYRNYRLNPLFKKQSLVQVENLQ